MTKSLIQLLVVFAAFAVVASAAFQSPEIEWARWKNVYSRAYAASEEPTRFMHFKNNMAFIEKFNSVQGRTFSVGLNRFADLHIDEFRATYLMSKPIVADYKRGKSASKPVISSQMKRASSCPPSENITCDWRAAGIVTHIKDQGQCGSCWAFSSVGAMEGAWAQKTGKLVSLSEQNLVDCALSFGCSGGQPRETFDWMLLFEHGEVDTEVSYPYQGVKGSCAFNSSDVGATISGHKDPSGITRSESELQGTVDQIGVMSVCIDASSQSFQLYTTGVYYNPSCSSITLDHCVTLVGYGTSADSDFWLVKNSWGVQWGQEGYIWMSRNRNNNCGIASEVSYPLV